LAVFLRRRGIKPGADVDGWDRLDTAHFCFTEILVL
jgi:hypothetical protein